LLPSQGSPYNAPTIMKRASLHTLGCRLNQVETTVLAARLQRDGYRVVEFGEPTDLLVVNTCSVTEDAERTCRYVIRKTLKHSPGAFVAVTGCYAQTGVQELRTIPGIDLIVGNQFKWDLPSFLPAPQALKKQPDPEVLHTRTINREDFTLPEYGEPDSTRALLKIQDGCNVMCSFCLIPFARGHERSRLQDDVTREAEALVARGYREIVLTGVNVGQYRQDELDLVGLIAQLEEIEGLDRIRVSSIEPTTITNALLDRMASSSKLCPYLHVPLQSGDDAILSSMNRPYNAKEFAHLIQRAIATIPHLGLGTDLMVGFPGETEGAFEHTLHIACELPFSYFHVFTYSQRPGTAAARLPDQVPIAVARKRAKILAQLSRLKRLAFAERYIGSTVPVLFESGEMDGYRLGVTANFLKVAVPSNIDLTNHLKDVRVTGASDRWAVGQLTEEHQSTRRVPIL
jgi:threonylcarbamoyladenosine tRNA methylthiotransferase MtaB